MAHHPHLPLQFRLFPTGLVAISILLSGCQTGPRITGPVRAIWVTRFDYKTADDVQRIIKNCKSGGFDTVLFQVRGNGTVAYPSKIEPWAEQFGFADPGFDPLATAIDEAHQRDMQLHPWINVMPGWRGPQFPADPEQLYFKHPDWFWYDGRGQRQPLVHTVDDRTRGWYASLNPCLPEVRDYLVRVCKEIVSNYDVDGLHLDYIRFPNEPVVRGEHIPDYPRDPRTLALYRSDTGLAPDDDPKRWNQWRSDCVTSLVADIHRMMRRTRPSAVLSSAVGSIPERALTHYQDPRRWIQDGLVDAVYLMNYTSDPRVFRDRLDAWLPLADQARIVPGLWFDHKLDVEAGAKVAAREIEIARDETDGFCVFAYSSLFSTRDDVFAKQNAADAEKRRIRRERVLPVVAGQATR